MKNTIELTLEPIEANALGALMHVGLVEPIAPAEACEKAGHVLIPTRGADATHLAATRKPFLDVPSKWDDIPVPFQPVHTDSQRINADE